MDDLISRKAVIDKAITIPIAKIVTEDKVIYRRIVFVEDIENLPPAQPEPCQDAVSRQAAIRWIKTNCNPYGRPTLDFESSRRIMDHLKMMPPAQSEQTRVFVELVVEYPDPELCTYKEYKGKPYYSIKYIENGETYVGYGTYNPEVLSQYLKEYFISSAQPEETCDTCAIQRVCRFGQYLGNDGYCSRWKRRTDEQTD